MSTEELEAAYLDAMKKLKGSMLGPQLAEPIEKYVKALENDNIAWGTFGETLKTNTRDFLADLDNMLRGEYSEYGQDG